MKYYLLFIFISIQLIANSQNEKGINFQAVARNADGSILSNKDISVRLSIRQGTAEGLIEYQEIKTVSTNVVGLFNLVLGSKENANIVVIGDYNSINWNNGIKYLQVEIDPFNSINFIYLGAQRINYVPYALVAASVDMSNVNGLSNTLNNKLSISDTSSMLKPYLKGNLNFVKESSLNGTDIYDINLKGNISTTKNITVAGNLEALGATSTLGTVEKPFKGLYLSSGSLSIASDLLDRNNPAAIISNVEGNLQISAGGIKLMGNSSLIAPRIEGTLIGNANTASKLIIPRNINGVAFDGSSDITINPVNTVDIAHGGTGAVSILGIKQNINIENVDNTTDASKPISILTQQALDSKENTSNKSISLNTDGSSDIKYPSAKAVKTYVDATTVSGAPDADASTKGILKLSGDLSGSAILPTIANNAITTTKIADLNVTDAKINSLSGSKITGNINGNAATATLAGNITATTNTSLIGLSNLQTVGTITNGTWSATIIDIAHGGTGANSLNGILLGTNGSGATTIRTAAYGSFYDLTDQTVSTTNTPTAIYYNTTDFAEGVVIESNGTHPTRIKVSNTGKYNIQFSAQLGRSAGTSTETISIWLRKNGTDVVASCTDVVIHGSAALSDLVAAWNFFQNLQANDYIEIMWSSTDTNLLIDYQAARTSPTRPAVPSIILTVQQVY